MFYLKAILICLLFRETLSLDGPHVCLEEKEIAKEVKVPTKIPVEVKTFQWCAHIPPRCLKTRIEYRDGFKTEIRHEKINVSVCCSGYVNYNERCIPICSDQCIHGICVEPNKCECEAGWAGNACNIWQPCPNGRKGSNCTDFCNCRNGAKCDPVTGDCDCEPGWTGKDCSKQCRKGFFGIQCSQICLCQNGGSCHHITGVCTCPKGFKGALCQNQCLFNELDPECNHDCFCENGGICKVFTGECLCQPGYRGAKCEHPCPPGTFGQDCAQRCDCPLENCDIFGCKPSTNDRSLSIIPASFQKDHQEGTITYNSLLLSISCLLLLILCLALLALIRYRRRVQLLSKERAYVTYVANKDVTDKYENPVYSYEYPMEPKLYPPVSMKGNNYSFIKNDLSLCKNNREKCHLPGLMNNSLDTHISDPGRSSECKLNIYEHASSNLYVNQTYKSTNSLYKEPIYAEIKGKDFEEGEVNDHYDRPKPVEKILNQESPKSPDDSDGDYLK